MDVRWFGAGLWLDGSSGRDGRDVAIVADKTRIRVFTINGDQQLTEVNRLYITIHSRWRYPQKFLFRRSPSHW